MRPFAFLATLALAGPAAGEAQVLGPDELCSDYDDSAIATFADADLEAAVGAALSVSEREDLTCGLVSGLTALSASGPGPIRYVSGSPEWPDPDRAFESLSGMQNLTGLTRLTMNNRWITDISALRGLTNLTVLNLHTNWISDLSPLSGMTKLTDLNIHTHEVSDLGPLKGLTNLTELRLAGNPVTDLSDIQPLLDNPGIGPGDIVELRLTSVTCNDQARLAAKGVEVRTELFSACR